jgi:hypothetical protein
MSNHRQNPAVKPANGDPQDDAKLILAIPESRTAWTREEKDAARRLAWFFFDAEEEGAAPPPY